MKLSSPLARRAAAIAVATVALLGTASCTPDASTGGSTTTTTEAPAAKPVLSPTSGPAGSFVNVATPNGECDPTGPYQYSSLQAALTIPSSGIVVTQASQYIGASPSTYAGPDQFVRLRIPPATAPGVYNVFLSCYSYLDTYMYSPAKFTVTAS